MPPMLRAAALPVMLALAFPAAAQDFSCRNELAETRCDADGCTMADEGGFTPMSLSRTGTRLTICAYSGCWAGPVLIRRTRGAIDLLYAEPVSESAALTPGPLSVIYDRAGRTALMRWGSYANIMTCR